jgi:hypothetical protein
VSVAKRPPHNEVFRPNLWLAILPGDGRGGFSAEKIAPKMVVFVASALLLTKPRFSPTFDIGCELGSCAECICAYGAK